MNIARANYFENNFSKFVEENIFLTFIAMN